VPGSEVQLPVFGADPDDVVAEQNCCQGCARGKLLRDGRLEVALVVSDGW
jgi:hypothetical protein